MYALPLAGDGERKPIELLHSQSQPGESRTLGGSLLSPDGRFLSYESNQSGKDEIYVRPFDPSAAAGAALAAGSWQVSDQGTLTGAIWRRDGKEAYYWAADRGLMAVDVGTAPSFEFGKPKLLFRLSQAVNVGGGSASVSRDGQRLVFAINVPVSISAR